MTLLMPAEWQERGPGRSRSRTTRFPLAIRVTRTSDRKEGGRKAFENDVLKKSAELLRFFFMTLLAKIPVNSRVSEFKLSRQEQVKNVQ